MGWEEEKTPKEEIHHNLSTDGPNHATRLRRHHSGHGNYSRAITPNWCAPQPPMSWLCLYKIINPPIRKADCLDHIRHSVWILSMTWDENMHFIFWANYANLKSHNLVIVSYNVIEICILTAK